MRNLLNTPVATGVIHVLNTAAATASQSTTFVTLTVDEAAIAALIDAHVSESVDGDESLSDSGPARSKTPTRTMRRDPV